MASLESLQSGAAVRGVIPDALVTVVNVTWHGTGSLELIYKDPSSAIGSELLFRNDEERLEVVEVERPRSLDLDRHPFRLTVEVKLPTTHSARL